jgi:hypothetical protein
MATVQSRTVKIVAAGTQSEPFEAGQATEGSFSIPAAFTGATVQPQFSNDALSWTSVGSPISVTVNNTYAIPDGVFKARFGRLVSASSEGAERLITLGLRR